MGIRTDGRARARMLREFFYVISRQSLLLIASRNRHVESRTPLYGIQHYAENISDDTRVTMVTLLAVTTDATTPSRPYDLVPNERRRI